MLDSAVAEEREGEPFSPLCSRIVSRSASSWHGWKSSLSALITGTVVPRAISSRPACA
jgi:hypothetical protein